MTQDQLAEARDRDLIIELRSATAYDMSQGGLEFAIMDCG